MIIKLLLALVYLRLIGSKPSSDEKRSSSDIAGVVSIQNAYLNFGHICCGVVLTHHAIISSASCFSSLPSDIIKDYLFVIIEKTLIFGNSETLARHINKLILHPKHASSFNNDIALAHVEQHIHFSTEFIRVLPIVKEELTHYRGICVTAGWWTELVAESQPKIYTNLSEVDVVMANITGCGNDSNNQGYCIISSENKNHCFSHGGNPLICDGGLAGLRPSTPKICMNHTSGLFFVPVTPHFHWIQTSISSKRWRRLKTRSNRSNKFGCEWKTLIIFLIFLINKILSQL